MGQKAVFFDIDGTIYNFDVQVPPDTREAIHKLRENGHLAFISTGRSLAFITEDILGVGFDGVLAGCGTYISFHDKEYKNHEISQEDVKWAMDLFDEFGVKPVYEGRDWLYFDKLEERAEQKGKKGTLFDDCFNKVRKPVTGNENDIHCNKMTMFIWNFEDRDYAVERLSERFDVIRHGDVYLEMVSKGLNKGVSVAETCKMLSIDIKDTFAFGDSVNDLEMFEVCNTAVCLGNGAKEAKDAADYITDGMEDGGVWNALKHFGLI